MRKVTQDELLLMIADLPEESRIKLRALTTAQAEIEALRATLIGISNADPETTAEQLRLAARIAVEHFAALSGSQT